MKYFVALLLAGVLTGCLGGSTAPGGALPPELQGGGSQPSSTGTVDPVDPLAGFPPLPADVDSAPTGNEIQITATSQQNGARQPAPVVLRTFHFRSRLITAPLIRWAQALGLDPTARRASHSVSN